MSTSYIHLPAVDTAATKTVAAVPVVIHEIDGIYWSYDATPDAGDGVISVDSPSGTTIFSLDVTAAGPNSVLFPSGLRGVEGAAVIVTLADCGAAVTGKLNFIVR